MNLIFGMKVIYLMRLDSLVKIVAERCTRNTTKVPTVWNINYQIIKNNNTTTQKKGIGVFFPDAFLIRLLRVLHFLPNLQIRLGSSFSLS